MIPWKIIFFHLKLHLTLLAITDWISRFFDFHLILSLYHQHSDQRCEPARLYPNGMAVFNICKTLQHECDGSSKEQIIKRKCRETRLKIASNQNLNSRKIKEVAIDKDRSFITRYNELRFRSRWHSSWWTSSRCWNIVWSEIILAANVQNHEDKIRRFRRYLANYFKTSGPYALNRWNYYQMILDNDQVVCSTNGSEVKGYLRVLLLARLIGFLGFFWDFSYLGMISTKVI